MAMERVWLNCVLVAPSSRLGVGIGRSRGVGVGLGCRVEPPGLGRKGCRSAVPGRIDIRGKPMLPGRELEFWRRGMDDMVVDLRKEQ